MRRAALLAAVLLCSPIAWTCETLQSCLDLYPKAKPSAHGIGPEEVKLAETVQKYGAEAVPYLVKLLDNGTENARQLAGYTLRDIDGLKPEHLPALIRARRRGDGWIPPAIARVGTPEAVAFLVDDLRRDPEKHTQVTWALASLGAKAAAPLAEIFACTESCNEDLLSASAFVLSEMKDDAPLAAVPRLLQIAGDASYTLPARRHAVVAIGWLGERGLPYVPQLNALKKADGALEGVVDQSLAGVGSADAVAPLLRELPIDPEDVLAKISRLGKNGVAAGPVVSNYLQDARWEVRIAAADTLGDIGYQEAVPALTRALEDPDDWKLVYAATLALGHLQARDSLPSLKQARDSHWYPPVRALASQVIAHVEDGAELLEPDWWEFSTVDGSPKTCSQVRERTVKEPKGRKLYPREGEEGLDDLAYESSITSYGPAEGTEPDKDGVIELNEGNLVEHVQKVRQVPNVALKVPDGWLVGTDRGEWGGELVHIPARGDINVLAARNIADIFYIRDRIVALAGMAHMVINEGFLLRVEKNDTGRYTARVWKRLPAAPGTSWLIEGQRLLVNTDGGSVVVDREGNMRMAECLRVRKD
jgi:HEAT repeat protein